MPYLLTLNYLSIHPSWLHYIRGAHILAQHRVMLSTCQGTNGPTSLLNNEAKFSHSLTLQMVACNIPSWSKRLSHHMDQYTLWFNNSTQDRTWHAELYILCRLHFCTEDKVSCGLYFKTPWALLSAPLIVARDKYHSSRSILLCLTRESTATGFAKLKRWTENSFNLKWKHMASLYLTF